MGTSGQTDVFLSYSKTDATIAADLARALVQCGLSIWWDAYLSPVKPFEETVKKVLLETRIIVGVLSQASLQSPWVRWELAQAHERGLRVVPLLARGLRQADLPAPLDSLHTLILENERSPAAMRDIADSIRNIVSTVRSTPPSASSEQQERKKAIAAERLAEVSTRPAGGDPGSTPTDERDYLCSNGFQAFLREQDISIAFTSFPLSRLFFIRRDDSSGRMLSAAHAPDARGLHADNARLLVGCETYVAEMADVSGKGEIVEDDPSHLFIPKIRHMTGTLDVHDIAPSSANQVLFANTRYSCLSSVSENEPVRTVWKPCFLSELAPEDRCHLNGLAMKNGKPAYASAVAATDVIDGWRGRRTDGGVVLDVARNRIICRGLSMPHSPRFHENRLWVLNSGAGELGVVEEGNSDEGRFESLAFLPGFLRGLAFVGPFAIVGLSRSRYEVFEGLPLHDRLQEKRLPPWSGIAVVDTRNGRCVEWFRLTGRVWEVSDVAVLSGVPLPAAAWETD